MAKIILFTHQKGGVGKSTLSYNVANLLINSARVGIVDWDYQGTLLQTKGLNEHLNYIENVDRKKLNFPLNDFDFIIIDTPPYIFNEIDSLIKLADIIIVPTQASANDLFAIERTADIIKNNEAVDKSLIVFNRIKSSSSLKNKFYSNFEKTGISIAKNVINDYDAITNSLISKGVSEKHKGRMQLEELTKEILIKMM